jgi:hypothetical protein
MKKLPVGFAPDKLEELVLKQDFRQGKGPKRTIPVVPSKKEQRAMFDALMDQTVHMRAIMGSNLERFWRALQPFMNRKRLEHFLRSRGVKLAQDALAHIRKFDKALARSIRKEFVAA